MPENNTFTTVRYDRPTDPSYDLMPGVSELPEINLVVQGSTYWADQNGFMVVWSGRRVWDDETDSYWLVPENAAWSDDTEFDGNVPDEVKAANESIASALTILHGIALDAVCVAYERLIP